MLRLARPILLTMFMLLLLGLLHVGPVSHRTTDNVFFKHLNQVSETYLDDSFKKAGITFALARTLNGLISVLQESRVQATLFGAGFSIALGQLLDPVNDLVERLSWVMMVSMLSLGVQKFAVAVGPWVSLKILFSAAAVATIIGLWADGRLKRFFYDLSVKLSVIAVLLIVFIPMAGLANQAMYKNFLEKRYQDTVRKIDEKELASPELAPDDSLVEQLKKMELMKRFRALTQKMGQYAEYVIDLSIVFVVQTMVLPLVTMWLFLVVVRYITGKDLVTPFSRVMRGEPPFRNLAAGRAAGRAPGPP